MEESIKTVTNVNEKANAITYNWQRYSRAKEAGFYYECLWILYGFAEDRTKAFFYYLGFTSEKKQSSVTGRKKIKAQVRSIYSMKPEEKNYGFNSFAGKLQRMIELIDWVRTDDGEMSDYQKAIKRAIGPLAFDDSFRDSLLYLNNTWRDMRNQLTHALMNKDPDAATETVQKLVKNGYPAIRKIDDAVKRLKKKEIRRKFNIQ